MTVFVVCKNDFPFEVYFYESQANERRDELQREYEENKNRYTPKVYVHVKEVPAFK